MNKIAWNKGLKGFRKGENSAEKNGMWRGNKVKLKALHEWVRSRFPKPCFCEKCKTKKPIDLANKGTYNRELKNWEWLCRKCHMESDGRLEKLIKKSNNRKGIKQTHEHIQKRFRYRLKLYKPI